MIEILSYGVKSISLITPNKGYMASKKDVDILSFSSPKEWIDWLKDRFAIAWRLQTAKKPETREKRMEQLLEMMKNHQKLH